MIHPTAVIHPSVSCGVDVQIGPFSVIGPGVVLGDRVRIESHAVISSNTTLGHDCVLHSFASIGGDAQSVAHKKEDQTRLEVGSHTVFHEFATAHRGTVVDQSVTRIGSHCILMAYTHVAHDCVLADRVQLVNNASLGGHVHVGERAIIGAYVGVKQHCRIGELAMLLAYTGLARDVLPFTIIKGQLHSEVVGLNVIGLARSGLSQEDIRTIKKLYRKMFRSEVKPMLAINDLESNEMVKLYRDFIAASKSGVVV